MSKKQKCFRNLSLFLLSVLMLAGCQTQQQSNQEGRYFTWVDDQGRIRRSPIPEAQNPVEARAQKIREQQQDATGDSGDAASSHTAQTTTTTESTAAVPSVGESIAKDNDMVRHQLVASLDNDGPENPRPENESDPAGPSADSAQAGVPADQANQPHKKRVNHAAKASDDAADSEYNLKNYPDGNELAAKGFIREGDPLPYFTWRDSQGNMRVSHYRPKGKPTGSSRAAQKVPRLTSALVLDGKRPETPGRIAPDVSSVMGLKSTNTIFQDWGAKCCQDLPVRDSEQWDRSREFQIDMTADTDMFTFSTGKSVYQLIRLPSGEKADAFVMRLRSYIHNGVFIPTLAFLDDQLNTRRLVTDLAFKFNPETWHSLGSFEAVLPVFPEQGDQWLLIMSTRADQKGQTVVEKDGWPTAIPHQAHGTLGLTEVE